MGKTMLFLIERSVIGMANPRKKQNKSGNVKEMFFNVLEKAGIVIAVITFLWAVIKPGASELIRSIVSDEIAKSTKSIKTDFSSDMGILNVQIDGINRRIDGLEQDIRDIKGDFYGPVFPPDLTPTSDFVSYANSSYITLDSPIQENNTSLLSYKSVIAYSAKAEEEYTVEQVADERLLLPYVEDGQEVYFWGQLSESGNWDGNCIVNIYENDELQMITDALYDDGDLLTCKQIFLYTTTSDKIDVWGVSKRTARNGFNSGETRYFVREENYTKEFTLETVQPEDIFSADVFEKRLTGYLEGFYSGNTSNGQFNDDTATAYMVKYFSDGTIKTLYVGNFRNGQFNDTTGNAWMVGTTAPGEPYSYYHDGPFINGEPSRDSEFWDDQISRERVEEIIQGYSFKCELNWGD